MSAKEVDRLEVIRRVLERRLKRVKAAQVLGVTTRQVRRLCDAYEREGAAALVSKRRGQPSNHRLSEDIQRRAVALVRQRFGRPVAFYSDKHSIFRVAKDGVSGRTGGVTQFGRALQEFNIGSTCAGRARNRSARRWGGKLECGLGAVSLPH